MTGPRLMVGIVVMGILLPVTLYLLLGLTTASQFFTLAASIFLTWGVADLLSSILEKPRLRDRSPQQAIREDLDRRQSE